MRRDLDTVPTFDASGLRVAVVTSTFNADITDGLRRGALEYLTEAGATGVTVLDVPGAFELPLLAQACAEEGHDAIVCLGAVIEGDTDHYEHVASRTSEGLMRVQLDTGVPVAFGVLTVRSVDQAIVRAAPGSGNKGREAAAAAIGAAMALRTIRSRKG